MPTETRQSRQRYLGIVCMLVLGCVTIAAPAGAEWSFDAYLGGAFLPTGDITLSDTPGRTHADFQDAFIVGGRFGYWFNTLPYLGVAFDFSYFSTELTGAASRDIFEQADLSRVFLSGLARLRLPLFPSRIVPRGQLEPYVAVGPTLSLAHMDVQVDEESKATLGLDVRAGLNFRLTRLIGVFAEYRLTWVDETFRFSLAGVRSTVETDPTTHYLLGGLSFRF